MLLVSVWLVILFLFHRLNRAKKLIEASDQAKTRFMANVTHELRTPLNSILGYTQLYKQDTSMMKEYGQGIKAIDRSADHLLLMINDILEFSRANEENLTLHPVEIDLLNFLNTIVEMTQISTQIKNLPFEYRFDKNLPALVLVDDKRLRQILLNIISNAVKFTETGRVSFSVTLKSTKSEICKLLFQIEDSGIGIPKSQQHTIFIPFQQLDNPITRAEGTGLGLTICQRLVNLMGSKLELKSEPKKGSEFWFELELPMLGKDTIPTETLSTELSSNSHKAITWPEADQYSQLIEHAKRHNILGIRATIANLESQPDYAAFLDRVRPYVERYRFKELLDWLDENNTNH